MRSQYRQTLRTSFRGLSWAFFFVALSAHSTKPCRLDSYSSNAKRSLDEWIEKSDWVAHFKVTSVSPKFRPYRNCFMSDKSQCAQEDIGSFRAELVKVVKGNIGLPLGPIPDSVPNAQLTKDYCAKDMPPNPGIYVFYGHMPNQNREASDYVGWERLGP